MVKLNVCINRIGNQIIDYGSLKAVKFIIGEDIHCKYASKSATQRRYCNGPLKPDTWYEVKMRAFTLGGYSDAPSLKVKTGTELIMELLYNDYFIA